MTYPATQTYWLERTDRIQIDLRRFARADETSGHYHDASAYFDECRVVTNEDGFAIGTSCDDDIPPHDDPRWPTVCATGDGYVFQPDDEWQPFTQLVWRRADTGEMVGLRDAPPGATWDAWWMQNRGPDGIALMVRCPNGHDWHVDCQASNCTRPGEPHQCWVRHGDPRDCNVTVDKNSPNTCAAGAGSIQAGDYHGFLQAGILTAG